MYRSIIALSAVCLFFTTSTAQQPSAADGTFTCSVDAPYRLCCAGSIQSDGSISNCLTSLEASSTRDDQATLLTTTTRLCDHEFQRAGYTTPVCCQSQDEDDSNHVALGGMGCVAGKTEPASKPKTKRVSKPSSQEADIINTWKHLGLPVPKQLRPRADGPAPLKPARRATVATKQNTNSRRETTKNLPAAQVLSESQKKSRSAGYTERDANRVLGLPAARKARARKDAEYASQQTKSKSKRSLDSTVDDNGKAAAPAAGARSAAERMGLPSANLSRDQAKPHPAMPQRSRKVSDVVEKIQSRKVNVKAPRWLPSNVFLFIG